MANEDYAHLNRRLEHIERRHVRLQRGAATVVLLTASLLVMGQVRGKARIVEGEAFVLKDAKGVAHGGLRVTESGAAELTLFSGRGKAAIQVIADPTGKHVVGMVNEEGAAQATLSLDVADGTAVMGLSDAAGKPRAAFTVHNGGIPAVVLSSPGGNMATLAAVPDERVGLVLAGKDKAPRVEVVVEADGSPSLKLLKDGKAIFTKP